MNAESHTQATGQRSGDASQTGLQVTWGRVFRVWWSLTWRGLLFGGIAGALVGSVIGFCMGFAGASRESIARVRFWAGVVAAIPVGLLVVRHVLRMSWSDFRIALVANTRPS